MSLQTAWMIGGALGVLAGGLLGLVGGFFWGRSRSDAEHARERAKAWRKLRQMDEGTTPVPRPPPPDKRYTEAEIRDLLRRTGPDA